MWHPVDVLPPDTPDWVVAEIVLRACLAAGISRPDAMRHVSVALDRLAANRRLVRLYGGAS